MAFDNWGIRRKHMTAAAETESRHATGPQQEPPKERVDDPVLNELGRIDYFLDHLARAVERGEVPRASYDRLAPRYLERRGELITTLSLEPRAIRPEGTAAATPWIPVPGLTSTTPKVPSPGVPAAPPPARRRATIATPAMQSRPAAPPRDPLPVATLLSYVGALLVVVAAAIFTVYNWESFSPLVKLASLLGATILFYVAGETVLRVLKLPVVGVALLAVGSALLLFDSWMLITAFNLSGPLPWAIALLACSAVYWGTETRVAGHWFGGFGAAAQVGWWWLLGQGLGWDAEWRIVALAVIALAWTTIGERTPKSGPLSTLGITLSVAGPILAVGMALGSLLVTGSADAANTLGMGHLVSAVVVSVLAAVALEISPRVPRGSALALVPVLVAALGLRFADVRTWALDLATLTVVSLLSLAYGVWRDDAHYIVAAVVLSASAAFMLPDGLAPELLALAWMGIGLAWVAVSALLASADRSLSCADNLAIAGPALIVLGSVVLPLVSGSLPLGGEEVSSLHVALAVAMPVVWSLACALRRSAFSGWAVFAASLYASAAVLAFFAPAWPSAFYAAALLLPVLAWSQADPHPRRFLCIEGNDLTMASELLMVAVPFVGLRATEYFGQPVRSWPVVVLLAVTALVWLAEALRRKTPVAWGAFAAAFVMTSGATAAVASTTSWAAAGTAGAASVITGVAALTAENRLRSRAAAVSSLLVSAIGLPLALDSTSALFVSLILMAAAFAFGSVATAWPEFAFLAAVSAVAAGFTALAHFDTPSWATLVFAGFAAASCLAPALLSKAESSDRARRINRSVAAAGAAALLFVVSLGIADPFLPAAHEWWVIGWSGLAAALVMLGTYVLLWSGVERLEAGLYVGFGLYLAALWVVLDGAKVEQAELYLIPAALYVAAMGYLWASRAPDRVVPQVTDFAAVALGVAGPFLLAFAAPDPRAAYYHALWAMGLSTAAVLAGLLLRVRTYLIGGLAVAAVDALWLSRSFLSALPKWVLIGSVGLLLIGLGLGYARKQSLLGDAASRVALALENWR